MPRYYVNKNTDDQGDHEVHKEGCSWLPEPDNRIYLGIHADCHGAMEEAKKHYDRVNGHAVCATDCHTG